MDESTIQKIAVDLRRETLAKGYPITMSTIGISMFPLLKTKDKIVIKRCGVGDIKCGDIILSQPNKDSNRLVVHRLT